MPFSRRSWPSRAKSVLFLSESARDAQAVTTLWRTELGTTLLDGLNYGTTGLTAYFHICAEPDCHKREAAANTPSSSVLWTRLRAHRSWPAGTLRYHAKTANALAACRSAARTRERARRPALHGLHVDGDGLEQQVVKIEAEVRLRRHRLHLGLIDRTVRVQRERHVRIRAELSLFTLNVQSQAFSILDSLSQPVE